MTDEEKLKEMDILFQFAKPGDLQKDIVFLFFDRIINDSLLDERELKRVCENMYYLLKFLIRFEQEAFE